MEGKTLAAGCAALIFIAGGGFWRVQGQSKSKATIKVDGHDSCQLLTRSFTETRARPIVKVNPSAEREIARFLNTAPALRERAKRHEPYINAAARKYAVDPRILWTIGFIETGFRSELISPKGARGLMQFMPETARRYGLVNPHDPIASVDAAARYVRDLTLHFGNRFDLILASYNAGEGTVDAYLRGHALRLPDNRIINPRGLKLGGIPPYAETRNYVARGLWIARLLPSTEGNEEASRNIRHKLSVSGCGLSDFALPQPQQSKSPSRSLYASTPYSRSLSVSSPTAGVREKKSRSYRVRAEAANTY